MNITLWGIRGSIPTFNPKTVKYGGHTSCIEVAEDGCLLILDAGSGIQNLNHSATLSCKRIDILLTHLHMDHIQGLGFFQPLFDPEKEVHIWGPATSTQNLRARLGRFFSPPLFPVYFRNLTCRLFIHEIDNGTFDIGPFIVQSQFVIHPSPTVGFRIQSKRGVLTYIPDHEPALGTSGLHSDLKWLSGSDLALGADLLLHDAQYTVDEYARKQGWGHCSMQDALQFASLTHVKRLLLMHHDPSRTDEQLDDLNIQLQAEYAHRVNFQMAVEGTIIEL